jgi:large subunit ribosomal protein L25
MSKIVINAETRTVIGKQVKQLRRDGKIPAVIYGHKLTSLPISLNFRESSRKLDSLTGSSLVEILLDGKTHTVIVREKQKNYIRDEIIHVDFQEVSLTEKIRASVEIVLEGLSPAIKDFDGVLVAGLTEIEVESFPQDLPEKFVVDVTKLTNIGDSIHLRDIEISPKVEVLSNLDDMIVLVASGTPLPEEEISEGTVEPEIIEKGKKEDEEI